MMLYRALISSVIDYGRQAICSASGLDLKKLDSIRAQALQITGGAFLTTPLCVMQVAIGELPTN